MKDYIKTRFNSRKYHKGSNPPCEVCWAKKGFKKKYSVRAACEIHHIKGSFKGKRNHKEDGSDLIAVCRQCHEKIHSKNNYTVKLWLLCVVRFILDKINEIPNYDKCGEPPF